MFNFFTDGLASLDARPEIKNNERPRQQNQRRGHPREGTLSQDVVLDILEVRGGAAASSSDAFSSPKVQHPAATRWWGKVEIDGRMFHIEKNKPARFHATEDSVIRLTVLFEEEDTGGMTELGNVNLSVAQIFDRFGVAMYHTWFLLNHGSSTGRRAQFGESQIESMAFDHSEVSKHLFAPMVMVSCCRSCDFDTVDPQYRLDCSPELAVARYRGLLHSHTQHLFLAKALHNHTLKLLGSDTEEGLSQYHKLEKKREKVKHLSSSCAQKDREIAQLKEIVSDLQNRHKQEFSQTANLNLGVQRQMEQQLHDLQNEVAHVKRERVRIQQNHKTELAQIAAEANKRIDQGNQRIITLQTANQDADARIGSLQTELEIAKEGLAQIQRPVQSPEASPSDVNEMQRRIAVLEEQKAALMRIVEDLYANADEPTGLTMHKVPAVEEILKEQTGEAEAEAAHGASAAAMEETRPAVMVSAADLHPPGADAQADLSATTPAAEPPQQFSRFLPSPQSMRDAGARREPQYSIGGASAFEDAYNAARE